MTDADDLLAALAADADAELRAALYVVPDAADADALQAAGFVAAVATQPARLVAAAKLARVVVIVAAHDGTMRDYLAAELPKAEVRELPLPPGVGSVAGLLGWVGGIAAPRWDVALTEVKRETWLA